VNEAGPAGATRATALIDLAAVEHNCARLAAELDGAELCAVVKADGYGHGAVECARAALAGGATWLAVATAAEATELRAALADARLFVMGALTQAELDEALAADADVAVWRAGFLELIRVRAGTLGIRPRLHVKWDTGMGRLGTRDREEVLAVLEAVAATADEPGSAFFQTQLERFVGLADGMRSRYPSLIAHAANSAATLINPASHFDMVRCGVAIYGLDPFQEDPARRRLEPTMELRSYVADVKRFEAGWSAGYGQRWRATEPTWVGVLPIGYGDGVRRALTNNAEVLVRGRRHAVVGTISMDNLTIDLGPETDVVAGDEAVLIGAQGDERILCEEVARRLATINYEVTCGVSARVPRRYQPSPEAAR
jgi:alanine racemase